MNVRQVIPKDAIPSVDDPTFGTSYFGAPEDRVIVYESADGQPRAYPTRILDYHEIVNDEADRPIAVTWCPLCGSAVVYDRQIDGQTLSLGVSTSEASGGSKDSLVLSFGVSGKLADDDLVMYDRETESEWKQSLGRCISGPLEGTDLSVLPATTTTYAAFHENYDGVVLQRPGGESEAAGEGDDPQPIEYDDDPYRDYEEGGGFGLGAHRGTGGREWDRDDIDPKTVVVGLEIGGDALGVPLPAVEDAGGALTVTVGGVDVVVFATDDGLHAFENPGYEFESADGGRRFRADGTAWNGAIGNSEDGRQLDRTPAKRLFAFAWQDDHGHDAFAL